MPSATSTWPTGSSVQGVVGATTRWSSRALQCADELGVPADPEFRSAFVAYLERGTRLAVINSQPGADVDGEAPMPRWGWGEVQGPSVQE